MIIGFDLYTDILKPAFLLSLTLQENEISRHQVHSQLPQFTEEVDVTGSN